MERHRITKQQCIDALQTAAKENGGKLTEETYRCLDLRPRSRTIIKIFGTWNEALNEAGISKNVIKSTYFMGHTREDAINNIKALASKSCNSPTSVEYDIAELKPAVPWIVREFGSWDQALISSGLKPRGRTRVFYTEETILQALNQALKRNGGSWLYTIDYLYDRTLNGGPAIPTILRHLGSWENAVNKARQL